MLARALHAAEHGLDRCFGVAANPLRQLGGIGYWLFWATVASGAYVYAFYDSSIATSHASVERLSAAPRSLGGLMRSTHRYAADAFVLVIALHLLRELAYRRYRGFRWFTWTTGVPLLAVALAGGIVGYGLAGDALAQFVGAAAGEAFAALPGFGAAFVRNFVVPGAMTDRFFSLLVFMHIALALALLLGMWLHVQRLSDARVKPAASVGLGLLAALAALALVLPASAQVRADAAHTPVELAIDWFYLFAFPLVDRVPPVVLWLVVAAAAFALLALPWAAPAPRVAAVIDADECNGCGLCKADCPYGAIDLVSAAGRSARAALFASSCAGCGICAGACPSANAFRSTSVLKSGIELPTLPVDALRSGLERALRGESSAIVAFGCDRGARVTADSRLAVVALPCIGMLPPSFVDYALKRGAAGVMIAGCAAGDCEYRFGSDWLAQRLAGTRMPRARIAHGTRVHILDDVRDAASFARELAAFRAALRSTHGDGRA